MTRIHRIVIMVAVIALGLAGITVSTAQADPGTSVDTTAVSEVHLITGDVVGLNAEGGVAQITPAPRPDGSTPTFTTSTSNDQVYVVPDDVESLLPDQLDRELFNVTELASYDMDDNVPVIVTGSDDTPTQAAAQEVSGLGVDVTDSLDTLATQVGLADVSTDESPAPVWDLLQELATAPTSASDPVSSITKVWLDQQIHVDSSFTALAAASTPDPGWMSLIGRDEAHAQGYTGVGVKVGIVDSGIDANHPDLAGQVIAQQDFTGLGLGDGMGHGTFVASEIAGTGTVDPRYVGVAPDAKLIIARVLDNRGNSTDSAIMAGIQWAVQQGADILNLSIGYIRGYDDGTSPVSQLVDQLSRDYDCLIVVAAGNDLGAQTVSSPATADEALTVSATYQDGSYAAMSSYGPRRGDGAVKPEILAPGAMSSTQGIWGALASSATYMQASGTSMAAPLVAGAAALLAQEDPSATHDQLRAKLMASATALSAPTVFQQGSGLLDIPAALTQTVTTTPTQLNLGTVPFPQATLTYINTGGEDQTYTLTTSSDWVANLGGPVVISPMWVPDLTGDDPITVSASTVTVPAGGRTSVDVRINPSSFSAGYVGGYVTATSANGVINTPIGWADQALPLAVDITTDTTTVAAGASLTATATVTTGGTPVANAPVRFTSTSADVTVAGDEGTTTCVTSEDGTCTVTITPTRQGTYPDAVTADIAGMNPVVTGSPIALDVAAPDITVTLDDYWRLDGSPASVFEASMDEYTIETLVAVARNSQGTVVDGLTIDFTIDGDSIMAYKPSCVTGQDPIREWDTWLPARPGLCQVVLDLVKPGDSLLHAYVNGVEASNSPVTIRVTPLSTQTSRIDLTRTGAPADGVSTGVVTGWAYDSTGAPMEGVDVSFSTDTPGASLSSPVCTTGEDGSCFIEVTSTVAQVVAVHAYIDGEEVLFSPAGLIFDPQTVCPQLAAYGSVTCQASSVSYYTVGGSDTAPVGTSAAVSVFLYQPLPIAPRYINVDGVEITWVITGDHEVASQTCVTNNGECGIVFTSYTPGTVTLRPYIGDWPLDTYPVTITFTGTPVQPGDWFAVAPTLGPAVVADGVSSWTGTLTFASSDGQPVADVSAQDIGFILPDEVSVSAITNNSDGTYTVNFTSDVPGEYEVTAYAAAWNSNTTSFNVMANSSATIFFDPVPLPPDPTQSSVSTSVSAVNVGYPACGGDPLIDPATVTVTAMVKDSSGASMSGAMVDFTAEGGLKLTGPASVQADANGIATTTVTVDPAAIGDAVVRASVDGVGIGEASVYVAVSQSQPPERNPEMIVVPTVSDPVWADGDSSYTATVTYIDGCGVAVSGAEIVFSVTGQAQLSVESSLTDENGVASVVVTDTSIEQVALSASVDGSSVLVGGSPADLTFADPQGPPSPTVLKANAAQISGTARPGTTVVVTYPVDGGVGQAEADVTSSGTWTLTTPDNAVDGPMTVAARDGFGRLSDATDAVLDVTAPLAPIVSVANGVEISGTAEADAWIQVWDADGGSLGSIVADKDGVWLVPTPDYAQSGEITVTATDMAGNVSMPRTVVLSIVPVTPSADPAQSTATLSTSSIQVFYKTCGEEPTVTPGSVTIDVVVRDTTGAVLPGAQVDFSADSPLIVGAHAVADEDGVATMNVLVDPAGTLTYNPEIRISLNGVEISSSPLFIQMSYAMPSLVPGHVALNAVPGSGTSVWSDGESAWTVDVEAYDMCDVPIARTQVNFAVTGDAHLSVPSAITDDNGHASVTVTDTTAESVTVTVTGDFMDPAETSIEFTLNPSPSPSPSPSPTPSHSPTPSPTPTRTSTPSLSPSPTPTPSPSPATTSSHTSSTSPTPSPTPTHSSTPSISPTPTPSPSQSSTLSSTPSISPTSSPTPTSSTTSTPSQTPTSTPTHTASQIPTSAPTSTPPISQSPTQTPTSAPTSSPTPTTSQTPTGIPSSPSSTHSSTTTSPSPSTTQSPTSAPTSTPAASESPTQTPTSTPTSSPTPTTSQTPTGIPTSPSPTQSSATTSPSPSTTGSSTSVPTSASPSSTQSSSSSPTSTVTGSATQSSSSSPTSTAPTPTNTASPTVSSSTTQTPTSAPTSSSPSSTQSPTSAPTSASPSTSQSPTSAPTSVSPSTTQSPTSAPTSGRPSSTPSTSSSPTNTLSPSVTSSATQSSSSAPSSSTTSSSPASTVQSPTNTASTTASASTTQSPTSVSSPSPSSSASPSSSSTTSAPTQSSTSTSPFPVQSSTAPSTSSSPTSSTSSAPPTSVQSSTSAPSTSAAPSVLSIQVSQSGPNFTFIGTGFVPGEEVAAQINSDTITLPAQTSDNNGMVIFQWTPPTGFPSGEHHITMIAPSGSITQVFTVSSPTTATTASGSLPPANGTGVLIPTGGTVSHPLIPIALFLLALSLAAIILYRRTTSHSK